MKITRSELKKIIKEVISELELFEGLTKAQEKLPEPLKKAILKKQKNETDTDESDDAVDEGLTKAQEKLPEPLKKAILKKQKNESDSEDSEEESIEEGNAFGAAVKSAREKGEKEFEVGGKKYKLKEKKEITEQEDTDEFVGEDEIDESSCGQHEDDEDEDVEEGNAFGAAVTKAKEDGDDEFEVDGETYKVKESTTEDDTTIEIAGKSYKISDDWSKLTLSERLNRMLGTKRIL